MLRLGLPLALGGFFIDQATKWWVLNHVMNPPQVIPVTGFFNLVLGFNTGVSFGLFGQAPAWLLMASRHESGESVRLLRTYPELRLV